MGNICCNKKKLRKKIVLLLLGLDNAGKTRAANTLTGDRLTSPVPTIGLSVFNLKHMSYDVKVFDLGGGPNIRAIWNKYFVDAHGIIFVIDSSDYSRFTEAKLVLEDILYSDKISGKPLLVLANKQDNENALDEIDVIEYLDIEQLVNTCKCPTLVQSCTASEKNSYKIDPGIKKGYEWLMNNVIRQYDALNKRVENDVAEQENKERAEMLEKLKRIRDVQNVEQQKKDEDAIESYSDYARKLNGEVKSENVAINAIPDHNADNNSEVSEDSRRFPPVYHNNFMSYTLDQNERPKSAVQIVKHQLQLNNVSRKIPLRSRINKTAPINLYDYKLPRSATERRRDFSQERRNLKSADDCLFTITNKFPNPIDNVGSSGDNFHNNILHRSNFEKNKLPPLKDGRDKVPWVHKTIYADTNNAVNVSDVE